MDDQDLEEGELNSEGDEDRDEFSSVDYEVLPRPLKGVGHPPLNSCAEVEEISAAGAAAAGPGSSRTMGVDPSYQHISRPTRPAPVLQTNEEDDALYDKSSSSSDDSDDEFGPSGRKCRRMPSANFRMPFIAPSSSSLAMTYNNNGVPFSGAMSSFENHSAMGEIPMDMNDVFKNQAAVFQQTRQPNNIWATVLQEEEVSDVMGKVNVDEYDEQHVLIDRGPETFSVKYKAVRTPIPHRSDSSSVSSGGLTDDELEYLRGTSSKKEVVGMDEGVAGDGKRVDQESGRKPVKRQYFTKKLRERKKRKDKVVDKIKRMEPDELGKYISEKLEEPKFHLIINAIEMLGKEAIIALFLKTAKIERHGGLMIMNQKRRRTAGGVFFYLLRGDRKFPKHLVDQIFAIDTQVQRMGRKRAHKQQRLKKLAKLEEMKAEHEQQHPGQGGSTSETATRDQGPCPVKNESKESSGSSEDEDVDSDEFCGRREPQTTEYAPSSEIRNLVAYEDQDFLDIDCDPSDLM